MTIDLSVIINKLQTIEKKFNKSDDPVERCALLFTVNHIAKHELPFDENDWMFKEHYNSMLRTYGANID